METFKGPGVVMQAQTHIVDGVPMLEISWEPTDQEEEQAVLYLNLLGVIGGDVIIPDKEYIQVDDIIPPEWGIGLTYSSEDKEFYIQCFSIKDDKFAQGIQAVSSKEYWVFDGMVALPELLSFVQNGGV